MRSSWVVSKIFQEVIEVARQLENTVQPLIGLGFHSSEIKDVDHGMLWLALAKEVWQPAAHVPIFFLRPQRPCTDFVSLYGTVKSSSWLGQVDLCLPVSSDLHGVHGREERCLSPFLCICSSCNQSSSINGVKVGEASNVVNVLGGVIWQYHDVLQRRIDLISS